MSKRHVKGEPPYYDGFDVEKKYSSVLFRPGLVVQVQELNEMQSILKQNIRNISGALLEDGDVIEGCQCIISELNDETNPTAKKALITAGRIYIGGDIFDIPETNLILRGAGNETIGVKLFDEVVTEEEDPSLLDTSAGYANAQMSGAHRQKTYATVVTGDPEASVIYNVNDGVLITYDQEDSENVMLGKINNTLARRTYDESGNYRVDGLQISAKGDSTEDSIMITISAGKAYIKGRELTRNTATTMVLERATDLRRVETETQVYSEDVSEYPLNNGPVITDGLRMKAYVETTTTLTKGLLGGTDGFPSEFSANSIASIQKVWDVKNGEYTIGTNGDCRLSGNAVKWNGGNEPDSGATYNVTFSYVRTMEYNKDFTLTSSNGTYYVVLINTVADDGTPKDRASAYAVNKPVNGQPLLLDYNFMLYRKDLILMDSEGNIFRIKGQSDTFSSVSTPIDSNENNMILGSVLLSPMSDTLSIVNNPNRRLSMNELQQLAERLAHVEESIAMSDLDREAMEGEDATQLVGIYTDGFIGVSKCDLTHKEFNCAVDLDNGELTLSAQEFLHPLSPAVRTDLAPQSSFKSYGSLLTSDPVETQLISVPDATGVRRINQYAVFTGLPSITIEPRQNNWVDTENITVQGNNVTNTTTLRRWWYHGNSGASWLESEKNKYIELGFADGGRTAGWNSTITSTKTNSSESVLSTAIKYMQQVPVSVTGRAFDPYTDYINVYFNGNKVACEPASDTYRGTAPDSLRADIDGVVKGTFTVPANTLCGTVEVQIYADSDPSKSASTTYTSTGTLNTVTKTVWNVTNIVHPTDPLAQTFQFSEDQFLSSVGLYFANKDNKDVTIQLRGVDNGYPNQELYAETVLKASEILTSPKGTTETKVLFRDPVFCEKDKQYAICILTESQVTSMFFSELGGTDIRTNVQLLKNPYIAGMMFSSSNAIAWTAHQDSNLKFNVYGNSYSASEGIIYFNELNNLDYDRMMLTGDVSTPDGTRLNWEYSKDSGKTWLPFTLYQDLELDEVLTKILIRVRLTNNRTVSPALLESSIYLVGFKNNLEGNYISRNIVLDDEFTEIKQTLAIYNPDNTATNVNIYYATDVDGVEWNSPIDSGKAKNLGAGWYRYTWTAHLSTGAKNFRAKINLRTNRSTIRPRVASLMNILT